MNAGLREIRGFWRGRVGIRSRGWEGRLGAWLGERGEGKGKGEADEEEKRMGEEEKMGEEKRI